MKKFQQLAVSGVISLLHTCPFLFLLGCINCYSQHDPGHLIITEIMAKNKSAVFGPDHAYPDWIELYNPTEASIDMGDYELSIGNASNVKVRFQDSQTIEPKAYRVIWMGIENNDLSLPFPLSPKETKLALSLTNGVVVQEITYPRQVSNISYGLIKGEWKYSNQHTPGYANSLEGTKEIVYARTPIFSTITGVVKTGQKISISVACKECEIRYETDGSEVTRFSPLYAAPIEINATTIIRARAFEKNKLASDEIFGSYILDAIGNLPIVSLITSPKNLWDYNNGIYIEGSSYKEGQGLWHKSNYLQYWKRPVQVQYCSANGKQQFDVEGLMKVYGVYVSRFCQKPLAIYMKKPLKYQLFDDRKHIKYNSFSLRNSGQDWIRSLIRDGFINLLVAGQMDVEYQSYRPAIKYINGEFWGIINLREKPNTSYLVNAHNVKKDLIQILSSRGGKSHLGGIKDYRIFINFIRNSNLQSQQVYKKICAQMDIQSFINYQMVEIYSGNQDWPHNNTKLWRAGENGKWRWILSDMDVSYGHHKKTSPESDNLARAIFLDKTINPKYDSDFGTILLRKLLGNKTFKDRFLQTFAIHLSTTFSPERSVKKLDSLEKLIAPYIPLHIDRWSNECSWHCGIQSFDAWKNEVNQMRKFAMNRNPNIITQLQQHIAGAGALVNLSVSVSNGHIDAAGAKLATSEMQLFQDVPIVLIAKPNPGYQFVKWDGDIISDSKQIQVTLKQATRLEAVFEQKNKFLSLCSSSKHESAGQEDLKITITSDNYNKILSKRKEAMEYGILITSAKDFVPAQIEFDGTLYDAEIRLKGDWVDYLMDEKKWSYRIKLKGGNTIMGMKKFSIHHPKARNYINEWLFHKAIKDEGLVGLRYSFIPVTLANGETRDWLGIYALEESFDKRTIESNQRREGLVLKFNEDKIWKDRLAAAKVHGKPYSQINRDTRLQKLGHVDVYSMKKVHKSKVLSKQFYIARNLLENYRKKKLPVDDVFDLEKIAMYTALCNLFGCSQTLGVPYRNSRFYYNPVTSRLEPIGFNSNAGKPIDEIKHFYLAKGNAEYEEELIKALKKVSQPKYVETLFENYKKQLDGYKTCLSSEFDDELLHEEIIKQNARFIQKSVSHSNSNEN